MWQAEREVASILLRSYEEFKLYSYMYVALRLKADVRRPSARL